MTQAIKTEDALKTAQVEPTNLLMSVAFKALNGSLVPIKCTRGKVKLKRGAGIFVLQEGSAIAMSGAVVIACIGTKVQANSGSVVLAHEGAEVAARKGSKVLQARVFLN